MASFSRRPSDSFPRSVRQEQGRVAHPANELFVSPCRSVSSTSIGQQHRLSEGIPKTAQVPSTSRILHRSAWARSVLIGSAFQSSTVMRSTAGSISVMSASSSACCSSGVLGSGRPSHAIAVRPSSTPCAKRPAT